MQEERSKIFREELGKLRQAELITNQEWEKLNWAHHHFTDSIRRHAEWLAEQAARRAPAEAQPDAGVGADAGDGAAVPPNAQYQPGAAVPPNARYQPGAAVPPNAQCQPGTAVPPNAQYQPGTAAPPNAQYRPGAAVPPIPPRPARPARTAQELRDRNITWVLVLGVVFTLLAGITLATGSWAQMDSLARTGSIALVMGIFFGISIFAEKSLGIRKTGFAFWSLGCMFLPVTILSAGYFELFGEWFSLSGDGRRLFMLAGTAICIPVFIGSSVRYSNRFFGWLTMAACAFGTFILVRCLEPSPGMQFLLLSACCAAYALALKPNRLPGFLWEWPEDVGLFLHLLAFGCLLSGLGMQVDALVLALLSGPESASAGTDWLMPAFGSASSAQAAMSGDWSQPFRMTLTGLSILIGQLTISAIFIRLHHTWKGRLAEGLLVASRWLAPMLALAAVLAAPQLAIPSLPAWARVSAALLLTSAFFAALFRLRRVEWLQPFRRRGCALAAGMLVPVALAAMDADLPAFLPAILVVLAVFLHLMAADGFHPSLTRLNRLLVPTLVGVALLAIHPALPVADTVTWPASLHACAALVVMLALAALSRRLQPQYETACFWLAQLLLPLAWLPALSGAVGRVHPVAVTVFAAAVCVHSALWLEARLKTGVPAFLYACATVLLVAHAGYSLLQPMLGEMKTLSLVFSVLGLAGIVFHQLVRGARRTFGFVWLYAMFLFAAVSFCGIRPFGALALPGAALCVVILFAATHLKGIPLLDIAAILPLMTIWSNLFRVSGDNPGALLVILTAIALLLTAAGWFLHPVFLVRSAPKGRFHVLRLSEVSIDILSIHGMLALIPVFLAADRLLPGQWPTLIAPLLVPVFLALIAVRAEQEREAILVAAIASLLLPCYQLLGIVEAPEWAQLELQMLPIPIVATLEFRIPLKNRVELVRMLRWILFGLIAFMLTGEAFTAGDLPSALIFGAWSLLEVLYGSQRRSLAHVTIGSVGLLMNVFIRTAWVWSTIPWWAYLLAAGLALIAFASMKEMQRREGASAVRPSIFRKIRSRFEDWE